ncbi:2-hydroxyisoflavanone dehydratase [Cajanus cajan]|nr:2-hydroxyisoflavanone dehydratase [Cajanus cajan]
MTGTVDVFRLGRRLCGLLDWSNIVKTSSFVDAARAAAILAFRLRNWQKSNLLFPLNGVGNRKRDRNRDPYFWGSTPIGSEPNEGATHLHARVWNFVYPCAAGGTDDPAINPLAPDAPSLASLGCSKLLVCVAGKDALRDRGVWYYEAVNNSGWQGQVEVFELEDEDHAFHIYNTHTQNANSMITRLASFLV